MMKTITSNINWENAPFVEFRDESGAIILMFEDKSSVLGNKVCVYDANENVITSYSIHYTKLYEKLK